MDQTGAASGKAGGQTPHWTEPKSLRRGPVVGGGGSEKHECPYLRGLMAQAWSK